MQKVIVDTRREHVRFSFLNHNYINHLFATENHVGDDAHIAYHRQFGLKTFFGFWLPLPYLWAKVGFMSTLSTLTIS